MASLSAFSHTSDDPQDPPTDAMPATSPSTSSRPTATATRRDHSPAADSQRTAVAEDDSACHEGSITSEKKMLVQFEENDPENPFNFAFSKKLRIYAIMLLQMFWVTGLSTIYAPVVNDVAAEFDVAPIVARLPLATFLLAFSVGPAVLTPLSEDLGRKPIYTLCFVLLYIFQIPCALAPNIETLIICRFIGGLFAAVIFNSVACVPDLWHSRDRFSGWSLNGWAFIAESITIFPIVGQAISLNLSTWRWVFWIGLIVGVGIAPLYIFWVPETRPGPILAKRAARLRAETGNPNYYAEQELLGHRPFRAILTETLLRPAGMLFTEPIVYAFALWDGLNYGIIYLVIESIVLIYAQYGFTALEADLVLLAFIIGYVLAIATFPLQRRAVARIEREKGAEVPEAKLWWTFSGGILFPIALYLIAATSRPPVPWVISAIGYGLFAFSSHILFLVASDYTVDSYGPYASSAVTGQSFAREIMAASLALVGEIFYSNVGSVGPRYFWPTMILALISTPMAAIPFIFYRYGPAIRQRSKFALAIKEKGAKA